MRLYTLPIVQPDLRHEETIIQAANSLSFLQSVITEVFDRIDNRIDENNARIQSLNERLDRANQKGQQLVEMRQAIKVLSPAEYTKAQCVDIPMTFTAHSVRPIPEPSADYTVTSKIEPIGQRSADEKLQFFHVKNDLDKETVHLEGFGPQPMHIDSVDALLLHSKPFNVFSDHRFSAQLKRDRAPQRIYKPSENTAFGHLLGTAPPSISNRKMYQNKRQEDKLFYSPSTNEAPSIDLPLDLPDLPGIAANVTFSAIGRPSTITTGDMFLPDLPDINFIIQDSGSIPEIPQTDNVTTFQATTATSVVDSAGPPPPPPPPPPPLPEIISALTITDVPLPPPPPTMVDTTKEVVRPTKSLDSQDRSNLMEAIRKAGGKSTLRSSSVLDEPKAVPKAATGGGSLMDDLNQRLAMRRKGITGVKETGSVSTEPQGVMNRISAMIPPPTRTKDTSSGTSEDDEWN